MYRFLKTADKKWVSAILGLEANRQDGIGGLYMKKGFCILLSSAMLMGTMPVYGQVPQMEQVTHTYRAEVGTKNFYKDDVLQPLDTEIYLKDGYVMLPVRTFFTAMGEQTLIDWNREERIAAVLQGENAITLDVDENEILVNGEALPVSGKMETKDGRLFVPLRNWKHILNACNYSLTDEDIVWNSAEQEAVVKIKESKIAEQEDVREVTLSGEGQAPNYAMEMTEQYDFIENAGDGYFIALKYGEDDSVGVIMAGTECDYDVIDSTGKVLIDFPAHRVFQLEYLGEDLFYVTSADRSEQYVVDQTGKTIFTLSYDRILAYSEGMAVVGDMINGEYLYGYVDLKGNLQIPLQFTKAELFSEGAAAVSLGELADKKCGFVDKKGDFVIEPVYRSCGSFQEGLAMVRTSEGVGFVNHQGKFVISPVYRSASNFVNGTAFAVTGEFNEIWIIDDTGKKLRKITEVKGGSASAEGNDRLMQVEYIVEGVSGVDHTHVVQNYDKNGAISKTAFDLEKGMSEGLAPVYDHTQKMMGYADETGKMIITPSFTKAEPFQDGYAVVKRLIEKSDGSRDEEWGIIANPLTK